MTKQVQDAYIVAATRTPIGKSGRGVFRNLRSDDLLVAAIHGALKQVPTLDPKAIEDAIVGCAMPEGVQGLNMGRIAVLLAGLPSGVGGVTVNRFCASGLTAVQMAADRIRVGEADVMIAAGAESMSMVPMSGHTPSFNPAVFANDENIGIAYGMGLTAEKVAAQWKVSREAQDEFALQSHLKALKAQADGEFADEITPIDVVDRSPNLDDGSTILTRKTVSLDEGPRKDTSAEGLAKLRAVFAASRDAGGKATGMGSVTAGNSSQTSDGAGCLILASERAVKQFGLQPLARFVSYAIKGVPPQIMGIGPIEAIPAALKLAGLTKDQLDWIELNEAFAAQALAVLGTLDIDRARVNPMGGAIALGHPLGATGAIRAATVVHALRRHNLKYGMVTMCVGTGQGAAGIFERV
ncbi:acetyl-CoA C-acyltransferase [Methylibium sp.]|uniref:acetyl-CoA C-acyltransferase n=1 Tax=Methylibium sp. TaxID=2067992 RepID=UPI00286C4D07|nr:acetyl-CoA C-acyltransferase [Methylibium sp.]